MAIHLNVPPAASIALGMALAVGMRLVLTLTADMEF
jgi:hypothetical protein